MCEPRGMEGAGNDYGRRSGSGGFLRAAQRFLVVEWRKNAFSQRNDFAKSELGALPDPLDPPRAKYAYLWTTTT